MGKLLSVAEASRELEIPGSTIYRWISVGIDGKRLEKQTDEMGHMQVEEGALFEMAERWEEQKRLPPARVLATQNGHVPVKEEAAPLQDPYERVFGISPTKQQDQNTETPTLKQCPYTYQHLYGRLADLADIDQRPLRVTLCYRHIKGGTAVGVAICAFTDVPNVERGKRIALGRADLAAEWHHARKLLSLRDGRRYRTRGYKRVKMWGQCDARKGLAIWRYDAWKALESVSREFLDVIQPLGKAFVMPQVGWRIDAALLAKEARRE